jgi:hypothetical protein
MVKTISTYTDRTYLFNIKGLPKKFILCPNPFQEVPIKDDIIKSPFIWKKFDKCEKVHV